MYLNLMYTLSIVEMGHFCMIPLELKQNKKNISLNLRVIDQYYLMFSQNNVVVFFIRKCSEIIKISIITNRTAVFTVPNDLVKLPTQLIVLN